MSGAPGPSDAQRTGALTAEAAGLVGCRVCGRVWPQARATCARCGSPLRRPDAGSLQAVWAWLLAGLVFYIPANLYPMLRTDVFFVGSEQSTILGGVIIFLGHGDYFVASVIFLASVLVPVGKFAAIGYLAWLVRAGRGGGRTHLALYEVVDFIGRWSMVDVFVVAVLSALVQLGFLVSIHPGPAAAAFAVSVAFTMISAQSFDSRLIWQAAREVPPSSPPDRPESP